VLAPVVRVDSGLCWADGLELLVRVAALRAKARPTRRRGESKTSYPRRPPAPTAASATTPTRLPAVRRAGHSSRRPPAPKRRHTPAGTRHAQRRRPTPVQWAKDVPPLSPAHQRLPQSKANSDAIQQCRRPAPDGKPSTGLATAATPDGSGSARFVRHESQLGRPLRRGRLVGTTDSNRQALAFLNRPSRTGWQRRRSSAHRLTFAREPPHVLGRAFAIAWRRLAQRSKMPSTTTKPCSVPACGGRVGLRTPGLRQSEAEP